MTEQELEELRREFMIGLVRSDQRQRLAWAAWNPIETAPKDGTRIMGRETVSDRYTGQLRYKRRKTWWGKASHVPLYGWSWSNHVENVGLWHPTHWKSL